MEYHVVEHKICLESHKKSFPLAAETLEQFNGRYCIFRTGKLIYNGLTKPLICLWVALDYKEYLEH